jgi:hypothetical protein
MSVFKMRETSLMSILRLFIQSLTHCWESTLRRSLPTENGVEEAPRVSSYARRRKKELNAGNRMIPQAEHCPAPRPTRVLTPDSRLTSGHLASYSSAWLHYMSTGY